jgi:hypothetical protein
VNRRSRSNPSPLTTSAGFRTWGNGPASLEEGPTYRVLDRRPPPALGLRKDAGRARDPTPVSYMYVDWAGAPTRRGDRE